MTQYTEQIVGADTAAEALYRFFSAFDGFDSLHPLGFEAEIPSVRREFSVLGSDPAADMAAVFVMEPTLRRVRRYVNGGETVRGACTVSGRVHENDCRKRHETAAFFASLAEYVRTNGERYTDGGRVYRIRPAAHPARLRLTEDGAVWELRCEVEVYEK